MQHKHHVTIFRDCHRYAMGPSLAVTRSGDWIVVFNLTVMHEVGPHSPVPWLHPPYDPEYRNVLTRSRDQGQSWETPRVLPDYDWSGTECPGLCVLENGDILVSVYQRKFPTPEAAATQPDLLGAVRRNPFPWTSGHGGTYVHRSFDGGWTWSETVEVGTQPYISGYSHRGAVELADGTLLLPLAAADPFYDIYFTEQRHWEGDPLGNERNGDGSIKVGKSAAFVAISRDGGHSWHETREIARDPAVNFYEPALTCLASGRLICHLRSSDEGEEYLYQVTSDDNGLTWTAPRQTPIWGFPADIVQLPDGRVLTIYGHRRPPFGIRACLSADNGDTWNVEHEIIIRDDLPSANLGYPAAIALADGTVFAIYWGEDGQGVTTIQGTFFKP